MLLPLLSVLGRPNALDREVNALSVSALLHAAPAALMDPARQAAALRLQGFLTPVWVVMIALQIGVLAWFWSSGRSARLRNWLRARIPSEFGMRFCFGALVAGIDRLAALVPQAVQYRYMWILRLNEILFRSWLVEWIASTLLVMAIAGTIAAAVLWLADRTHQWYLYTIAGVMGFTLLIAYANPFVFAPAYTHMVPAHFSGQVAAEKAALEKRTDVHIPFMESRVAGRTDLSSAYLVGWGGSQRAVLSDTLFATATAGEIEFVIARMLVLVSNNSALQITLVQGAFLIIGTALAVFISDRIGFRRDDDPVARLALLGAIMGGIYLIALPFYNGYVRSLERSTDIAAVTLTGDRASAIRSEVRRADIGLVPLCPNAFALWYFDSRQAPGSRISALQGRPDVCATPPR